MNNKIFLRLILFSILLLSLSCKGEGKKSLPFVVATDYPTLQDAVDALPPSGGTVYLPAGRYILKKTLNLSKTRGKGEGYPPAVRIIGEGHLYQTVIEGVMENQPVIDLSGSAYCEIRNVRINSRTANAGILLARPTQGGGSSGSNYFENVFIQLQGKNAKACVYSMGSEVNRFVDCYFSIYAHKGICFHFTPANPLKIKSPYIPQAGGGCNTELAFYGCQFSNRGVNSIGLRVDGFASDVRIYSGYFSNQGLAAIYLDGTKACLDNVAIYDIRIEGEWGKHCLYAKGYVRNVYIRGGAWISGWGENICFEPAATWDGGKGEAYGWNIENVSLSLSVGNAQIKRGGKIVYWKGFEQKIPLYEKKKGEDFYTLTRFYNLRNSRIDIRNYSVAVYWDEKTNKEIKMHYAGNVKGVVVENLSEGNMFILPERKMLLLKKKIKQANQLIVLDDNGKYTLWHQKGELISPNEEGNYRVYFLGRSFINLTPQPVKFIKNPKKGDIAIDKSKNKIRLAIFDGEKWLFFEPVK